MSGAVRESDGAGEDGRVDDLVRTPAVENHVDGSRATHSANLLDPNI